MVHKPVKHNTHNHVTRDIKPLGQCPACDDYHNRTIPNRSLAKTRDESAKNYCEGLNKYNYALALGSFKAGFDCRDKLDNEALKVAVEALEHYEASHYCLRNYPCDHDKAASKALAEISKLMEG